MTALFFECGCCGEFHKPLEPSPYLATALYLGDCRNDVNRLTSWPPSSPKEAKQTLPSIAN